MTDPNEPAPAEDTAAEAATAPPPYGASAVPESATGSADATPDVVGPPPAAPAVPGGHGYAPVPANGPIGQVRSTGVCVLLTIVTLGFYTWYWYYKTSDEMKRHSGDGIGGGIALILAIFVGIVMPFLSSSEVGKLYQRDGKKPPVSGATGLWYLLLGWVFFIGAIVWFVKTNGALNDYWKSKGAVA